MNDWLNDLFKPVTETISTVGGWLSDNPGAASAIGGAAASTIDYLNAEQQRDFDQRRAREERDYRDQRSMASSGTNNYGSHYQGLTKGLLVS